MKNNNALPVFTAELGVKQSELDYINTLMSMTGDEIYDKYGLKRDETITNTIQFEDGCEMDIKVVMCDHEAKPYIDIVLFDENGCEMACDTGDDETIEGEYEFETDDAIYKGIIKSEERSINAPALPLSKLISSAEERKNSKEQGDSAPAVEIQTERF